MISLMLELKKRDMMFKYDTMSDELQLVIPSGADRTTTWVVKKNYSGYSAVGINYTKITASNPVDLIKAINNWHNDVKEAVAPLRAMETLAATMTNKKDRDAWRAVGFPEGEINTSSDPELYFMYGLGIAKRPALLERIVEEFFKIMNISYDNPGLVIAGRTFQKPKGDD